MSVLSDLAVRLESEGIGTIHGPDPTLVIGSCPASPATVTYLRETPMGGNIYTMGRYTHPVLYLHAVQVITRAPRYVDAEQLAWRVFALLDAWEGTINDTVYARITARETPCSLGVDENNRVSFVTNYVVDRIG